MVIVSADLNVSLTLPESLGEEDISKPYSPVPVVFDSRSKRQTAPNETLPSMSQ